MTKRRQHDQVDSVLLRVFHQPASRWTDEDCGEDFVGVAQLVPLKTRQLLLGLLFHRGFPREFPAALDNREMLSHYVNDMQLAVDITGELPGVAQRLGGVLREVKRRQYLPDVLNHDTSGIPALITVFAAAANPGGSVQSSRRLPPGALSDPGPRGISQ